MQRVPTLSLRRPVCPLPLLLLACLVASAVQADTYRFQPMFFAEVSLALGIQPKFEAGVLTFGIDEAVQRFPTEVRMEFDSFQGIPLDFPDEAMAVIGVKPSGETLTDTLIVPLDHVGEGVYQIANEPTVFKGVAAWTASHRDELGSGQVVLERIDGFVRATGKAQPWCDDCRLLPFVGRRETS